MAQANINTISIKIKYALTIVLLLSGCTEQQDLDVPVKKLRIEYLSTDAQRYTQGLNLFQTHCAACHGNNAQGSPEWPTKDANGNFRPPPLNDKGRTWHHPKNNILDIINNGTISLGGGMPAWKGRLSDQDIEDILYWIQSQWSKQHYEDWYRLNDEFEQSQKEFESYKGVD